jgi:TRAP-type uncharacterized transport system fused permease subunit
VQEALKAILELLLAALAAYLAAKKLMEELEQELEPVLHRAMELFVLLNLAALVIVLLVVAAFEAAAAVLAILATAALLILVFSPPSDEGSPKPGMRTDENAPITIRTRALELHRLSPAQFAGIASRVQKLMQQFHEQGPLPSTGPAPVS